MTRAFTPGQVALATFLGSPIAGGVLMALNHRRVGQGGAAAMSLFVGGVVTAVLVVAGFALPDKIGTALAAVGIITMLQFAKVQEPKLGPTDKASTGAAVGIGLALLVLIGGAVFGYLVLDEPPAVHYGHDEDVQYARGATQVDAKIVGDYLKEMGVFDGKRDATVRVEAIAGEIVVKFVVGEGAWASDGALQAFSAIRAGIAEKLGGRVVVVKLCDDAFDEHRTIR